MNGNANKIIVKSKVGVINIFGNLNEINGLDQNCLIDNLNVNGNINTINLNQSCSNVTKTVFGNGNKILVNGSSINNDNNNNANNNFNNNNFTVNYFNSNQNVRSNIQMNINGNNYSNNGAFNTNDFNRMFDNFNNIFNANFGPNNNFNNNNYNNNHNFNINNYNANSNNNNVNANNNNANNNNSNRNDNSNNNNNNSNDNNENLSDYENKKKQLILEMDEYQYKHIQKYDSRKETECAICLNEFIGVDIIKAFYKCEHIFHKNCLLDWLKKSDSCPLCNHNLKDDIN